MADLVVNLRDGRPVWSIPDAAVRAIREAFPPDWTVHVAEGATDGSGDGGGDLAMDVREGLRGARVYLGFGVPEAVFEAAGDTLEWVHSGAAGVGSSLHPRMHTSGVRFTNSAGIHGPPIAETVVGMLLHFVRGLDFAVDARVRGAWETDPFLSADTPVREIAGMPVGIVGYGGIGSEIGRRLRALGAEVTGLRRAAPEAPLDPFGVRLLHGDDGLDRLLEGSEALVLCAPLTAVTRGMLSRQRIRALRPGAIVVNVGRGALLDEEALVEALRSGHLRGAGLDVFAREPLPAGHPLWTLPNVLLTPHVSAVTRGFWAREVALVVENARRLLAGEPLRNEVDRTRGY